MDVEEKKKRERRNIRDDTQRGSGGRIRREGSGFTSTASVFVRRPILKCLRLTKLHSCGRIRNPVE